MNTVNRSISLTKVCITKLSLWMWYCTFTSLTDGYGAQQKCNVRKHIGHCVHRSLQTRLECFCLSITCYIKRRMGRNLGQSAVRDAGSILYISTLLSLRSLVVKQSESYQWAKCQEFCFTNRWMISVPRIFTQREREKNLDSTRSKESFQKESVRKR